MILSAGLFNRVAALSGCTLAPWSVQSSPNEFAQKLAKGVDCPTTSSEILVDCLRRVEPYFIIQVCKAFPWSFQKV